MVKFWLMFRLVVANLDRFRIILLAIWFQFLKHTSILGFPGFNPDLLYLKCQNHAVNCWVNFYKIIWFITSWWYILFLSFITPKVSTITIPGGWCLYSLMLSYVQSPGPLLPQGHRSQTRFALPNLWRHHSQFELEQRVRNKQLTDWLKVKSG